MTKPLVSIIMPVYNGETFLAKSLDSALSQSIGELEVLCVNDGSTDSSGEILAQYAAKDSRVRVFEQPNLGSGPARNLAIDEAQGKYVAFLDSDDFYPNDDTLALLYQKAEENNVMICGGSFSRFMDHVVTTNFSADLAGYTFSEEKRMPYRDYQFDYGYQRFLYNTEFLRQNQLYFPPLKRFQDVPFFVGAMISAGEFYAIPDVTYRYRKHGRSVPSSEWPTRTFCDVLRGITQNLIVSKEAGLERLHAQCWKRFCHREYYEVFKTAICRRNERILAHGLQLIDALDFDLLTRAGVTDTKWIFDIQSMIRDIQTKHTELLEKVRSIEPSQEPLITVVMPSLNVEPFIRQCVESVMQQTLTDLEILCIDAGSTDGTLEILQEYAAADRRIRVIHAERKSYGLQVNMGIREARGKYLAIVETDDHIPPEMYEQLLAKMEEHSLEAVKADFYAFFGKGRKEVYRYRSITPNKAAYDRVLCGEDVLDLMPQKLTMAIYIWAGLYRTDFLRKHAIYCQETPGASFQDNGFYFRLLMHVKRLMFVNTPLYRLRRDNPNSSVMSSGKIHSTREEYDFIRAHLETMEDSPFRQRLIHFCAYYRFVSYLFTYGRIKETDRPDFLQRMSAEFRALEASGELDMSLLAKGERTQLASILDDPAEYYLTSTNSMRTYYRTGGSTANPKQADHAINRSLLQKLLFHAGKGLIYWSKNGLFQTLKQGAKVVLKRLRLYPR